MLENNPARALRALGPQIAARVFNQPLLIDPTKLEAILWAIGQVRSGIDVERPTDDAVMQPAASVGRWENRDYERGSGMLIDGGVGIIPITGTLVNRGAWIGTYSGLQSYDGIAQQLRMAAENDRVHEVLLDLNSPGGEVGGVVDLASEIRDLDSVKPVTALVADMAASAAYWLAAAAREIHVTETGIVGSIGVVLTHQDVTGAAKKAGVKITQIHAGADKLIGSPYKPMSDSDREKLQALVNESYEMFVEAVARYRGVDAKAIRATEARIYRGKAGVAMGLADSVTTGRALLAQLQARVSSRGESRTAKRGIPMSNPKSQGGAETAAITQEEHDQAVAAARAEGLAAGRKEGATAERARVKSILTDTEAKGRESLALHLAFETDQAADAAVALLKASEKAKVGTTFDEAMRGKSPQISGQDDGDAPKKSHAESWERQIAKLPGAKK